MNETMYVLYCYYSKMVSSKTILHLIADSQTHRNLSVVVKILQLSVCLALYRYKISKVFIHGNFVTTKNALCYKGYAFLT